MKEVKHTSSPGDHPSLTCLRGCKRVAATACPTWFLTTVSVFHIIHILIVFQENIYNCAKPVDGSSLQLRLTPWLCL